MIQRLFVRSMNGMLTFLTFFRVFSRKGMSKSEIFQTIFSETLILLKKKGFPPFSTGFF